jgi:hypothetical protein
MSLLSKPDFLSRVISPLPLAERVSVSGKNGIPDGLSLPPFPSPLKRRDDIIQIPFAHQPGENTFEEPIRELQL